MEEKVGEPWRNLSKGRIRATINSGEFEVERKGGNLKKRKEGEGSQINVDQGRAFETKSTAVGPMNSQMCNGTRGDP